MALLEGLDVLVLDGLRHRPHPTHFSWTRRWRRPGNWRPRRTLFTHVCHDLEHEATNAALPPGMELAYDGLRVPLRKPFHGNISSSRSFLLCVPASPREASSFFGRICYTFAMADALQNPAAGIASRPIASSLALLALEGLLSFPSGSSGSPSTGTRAGRC